LQDDGEVGLAFVPARARLPAVAFEEGRRRRERIGGIVNEVRRPRTVGRRRVKEPPKLVSWPQIATTTGPGTPKRCSIVAKGAA